MFSPSMLEIKNLNAWYGSSHALKNISATVARGSVLALIGPSGCGKSTFLRCLNRLHEEIPGARATGTVRLLGRELYGAANDPVWVRRKIGMVFQKPNPFPTFSIFDNVAAGVRLNRRLTRAELRESVERALRMAALWDEVKDKLKAPGVSLSGGQQQRLCIARALALEPLVLLMDEPTSALDPISTARIEELISSLKETVTILIVTHNIAQATRCSDAVGFFWLGELVELGDTRLLMSSPKDKRTHNYVTGVAG